jgi:hypothetical protein
MVVEPPPPEPAEDDEDDDPPPPAAAGELEVLPPPDELLHAARPRASSADTDAAPAFPRGSLVVMFRLSGAWLG